MRPCKIIGITGGMGTGKTTVSNYLKSLGYKIIDADKINHQIMAEEKTQKLLEEKFGSEYLNSDGFIDRKKLGSLVFENSKKLEELEGILHPLIFAEMKRQIEESNEEIIFLDIPLLFETYDEIQKEGIIFDHIITVYLNRELQIDRIKTRDKLEYEEILKRLDAQICIEEKRKRSSHILENTSTIEELKRQVDIFLNEVKNEIS